MSDFLDEALATNAPTAREVTIDGKTGTVFFRRYSGVEKQALFKGQKVSVDPTEKQTIEIDMGENEHMKHLKVLFSVCKEDGSRRFKNVNEVEKFEDHKLSILSTIADEVNKDADAGKD